MDNLENLERKVALLQSFHDSARAHSKDVEELMNRLHESVKKLREFDESKLADLQCKTDDLSRDGPSDSGEHQSSQQDASGGDMTPPILESHQDLVEYVRSLAAAPPSTSKSDMAVGGGLENEMDQTLTALEHAGDLFRRDSEELRELLQKIEKGGVPECPVNPATQCVKYWMTLVETLQSSRSMDREAMARQKRRLTAEWTLQDSSFKEAMLLLRDRGRDQVERQKQSLHQQKQLKQELKQDIKILDELAVELEDRNLEAIDEIKKKHIHNKASAAKKCQQLVSEVRDLQESLEAWNVKARDALMTYSARSEDERPPAYTGGSAVYKDEILKAALDSLVEIQSQTDDAGIEDVDKKLAVAEAAVDTAKSFVESDPVSQALEAASSLDALLEQDKIFVELKTEVGGRSFEEWLLEIEEFCEVFYREGI